MEIPKLSTSNSKFILCGPWRPVVLISSNDVWPHFLSSPAGRRWFRHSQEDGGGRLTTLIFFSSVYWRPAWRRRPAKRSLLFSKEVKNPSPSSPPPPPQAFWSQTFSRSYWTQTLSDSTSHSKSWQAAFYRKSQFLLEESWSVCVLYVLLVFQGVWVFYIYFAVSFYFLESEEVYLKEMSVDDCSWRWCYLISEQHKQLEVPTRVYRVKSVFTLEMWLYYWMHLSYWSFA